MFRRVIQSTNILQPVRIISSTYNCSSYKIDKFTPIYKFPHIKTFSLLNRLKVYQTIGTVLSVPVTFGMAEAQLINFGTSFATTLIGISGCVLLYTFGAITSKLVGFVYINQTHDRVKISHVDFWGARRDEVLEISDVIPFSELPHKITDDLFLRIKRHSTTDTLKISVKKGEIIDQDSFKAVFS